MKADYQHNDSTEFRGQLFHGVLWIEGDTAREFVTLESGKAIHGEEFDARNLGTACPMGYTRAMLQSAAYRYLRDMKEGVTQ